MIKHKCKIIFTIFAICFVMIFSGLLGRILLTDHFFFFQNSIVKNAMLKLDPQNRLEKNKQDLLYYFVRKTMFSDYNNLGEVDKTLLRFIYGWGMCNHQAQIYSVLLQPLDIKASVHGLTWKSAKSHHAVVYVSDSTDTMSYEEMLSHSSYYDVFYGEILRNKQQNNVPYKISELCGLPLDYLKTLTKYPQYVFPEAYYEYVKDYSDPMIFCRKGYISENIPISKRNHLWINTIDWLRFLPAKQLLKTILFTEHFKFIPISFMNAEKIPATYQNFPGITLQQSLKYIFARIDHIFLNLPEAIKAYQELVDMKNISPILRTVCQEHITDAQELMTMQNGDWSIFYTKVGLSN